MKLKLSLSLACCLVFTGISAGQNDGKKAYAGEEDVCGAHEDAKVMLGTFVGGFGERKITIRVDRIIGTTVTSVVRIRAAR